MQKKATAEDLKKQKHKPIGGKYNKTKKRDAKASSKGGIKTKNYKHKNDAEEDEELKEKLDDLKRFYNQLRVKKGDLKPNREQKTELIDNCLKIIGKDQRKYAFKHDGCRIMQSMLKHGTVEQKKTIIGSMIDIFAELVMYKYSYHLAYRMVEYCDDDTQKEELLKIIMNKVNNYITHIYASEVVEQMYSLSTPTNKKRLLHAFYGNLFLILQENKKMTIKALVKEKPIVKDEILNKLENLSHKLIDKGLTRHTIVQAIIYDFVSIASDEQQNEILQMLLETFPALLSSKQGLKVACGLFAIASSKERRSIVKTIKPLAEEMSTNPVSSLFLLYIANSLDDTVLGKKSVVNTLVKNYEDIHEDKNSMILYSCLLTGIENPVRNVITKAKLRAMFFNFKNTTSKKEAPVRRKELLTNLVDEISTQMEKNMVDNLCDKKPFIITSLIHYCIEQNDYDEFLTSVYRALEKEITAFGDGNKIPVVAHSSVHRVIKELMVCDINMKKENPERE